jgi:limonene-1,2-epoxide hydrolase
VKYAAVVLLAVGVIVLAGCGSSTPSPADVVNEWAQALRTDDNERAASLFAPNAGVIQGNQLIRFRTHAQAVEWNRRLPCSGRVVGVHVQGSAATATFRLANRKHHRCADPPNAEVVAVFVVEHGKIVLWVQIESRIAIGH